MAVSRAETNFPTTLEGFGYTFNQDGELRKIDPVTGKAGTERFNFSVSEDDVYNQKHYEALGEVITELIYEKLQSELDLQRFSVPENANLRKGTYFYASPDILTNSNKLLILIHGSGVVRAGQWSRSLIINDSMKSGSQFPFIKKAKELGYSILVTNTNDNTIVDKGKVIPIKGSRDPVEHACYIWKHYVQKMEPRHIAIVAHSYGGVVAVNMANTYFKDFNKRVFAIAMTDSVHSLTRQKVSSKTMQYLRSVSRNWVSSDKPLDADEDGPDGEVKCVSAGHTKHEMTSYSSMDSVFKFLEEMYASRALRHQEL